MTPTNKILSPDFIKKLIKEQDEKVPKIAPVFTSEEQQLIRKVASQVGLQQTIEMRKKLFKVKHFIWKKVPWVTIRPADGSYTPMVSGPTAKFEDKEWDI